MRVHCRIDTANSYHSYISEVNTGSFDDWKRHFQAHGADVSFSSDVGEERWHSEIAFKIAGAGKAGIQFLISQIDDRDDLRLREILSALSYPRLRTRKIHQILKRYVKDKRPFIASEAIDSARKLGYKDFLPSVLRRRNSTSPYIVGSVLRYLSQLFPKLALPLLLEALSSNEHIIVENAIDELDDLGAVEALAQIQSLQYHSQLHVREAARSTAKNLQRILWGL